MSAKEFQREAQSKTEMGGVKKGIRLGFGRKKGQVQFITHNVLGLNMFSFEKGIRGFGFDRAALMLVFFVRVRFLRS